MKIESTTGCVCDSLTVDGVETSDMQIEDVKNVARKLIDAENDLSNLQYIIANLVEMNGDFENLGHCEECGDWIVKYTLEV